VNSAILVLFLIIAKSPTATSMVYNENKKGNQRIKRKMINEAEQLFGHALVETIFIMLLQLKP
jgi:hypothetical protein